MRVTAARGLRVQSHIDGTLFEGFPASWTLFEGLPADSRRLGLVPGSRNHERETTSVVQQIL